MGMQRYFFDFRDADEFTQDTVGCDFASVEEAFLETYKAAQEMWSELLRERRDPRGCSFAIRDRKGNVLFVLPFEELLESCRDKITVLPARSSERANRLRRANAGLQEELKRAQEILRQSLTVLRKA